MKRIGIIGGMSYRATLFYYEQINRQINEALGRLNSADLVIRSVNFEEYCELMNQNQWKYVQEKLALRAKNLAYNSGCNYVAMATNTMHKFAPEVKNRVEWLNYGCSSHPKFVHIGDCIAEKLKEVGAKRVMLLGTKYVITDGFMKQFLSGRHNIDVVGMRDHYDEICEIDRIISLELRRGIVDQESKAFIQRFIRDYYLYASYKPEAIVLCSTELNALLKPGDTFHLPLIDSAQAHVDKLVKLSLSD